MVLSIAGFDPSSGAGFTADLKVFAAYGLYGVACPTGLTVQSTRGVVRTEAVSAALVSETLRCLEEDLPIVGVKIGMLGTAEVVRAVAEWLEGLEARRPGVPVVLDPVLRASSGAELLDPEALEELRTRLLPQVTAVTPNLPEAAMLLNRMAQTADDREGMTAVFARGVLGVMHPPATKGEEAGSRRGAVVITGGHLPGAPDDYLLQEGEGSQAGNAEWFRGEWIESRATHGTGCAFSSALLCGLVRGQAVREAVAGAKQYVREAMAAAYPLGHGKGPLHHLYALYAREPRRGRGK